MAEAQSRIKILWIFHQQFSKESFGLLKITGAQSSLGASMRLVAAQGSRADWHCQQGANRERRQHSQDEVLRNQSPGQELHHGYFSTSPVFMDHSTRSSSSKSMLTSLANCR